MVIKNIHKLISIWSNRKKYAKKDGISKNQANDFGYIIAAQFYLYLKNIISIFF